jgi:hypothetical protein
MNGQVFLSCVVTFFHTFWGLFSAAAGVGVAEVLSGEAFAADGGSMSIHHPGENGCNLFLWIVLTSEGWLSQLPESLP